MKTIFRFRWFLVMWLLTVPWVFAWFFRGARLEPVYAQAIFSGISIMAAAFILTWAAEAAECDFSGPLVLALLALIAVLPEYAIDATFALKAGRDIAYAPYAVANMTGANRLLIGLGWASVVFIYWLKTKKKSVGIPETQRIDCAILAIATIYAFVIAWKGTLAWFDTVFLAALFAYYFYDIMRHPSAEMEAVGPAGAITVLRAKKTRTVVVGLFMAYAAFIIFVSAEPFSEGLVATGRVFGIEEFFLVQWLAPLASESPEFIVAILFVLRLHAQKGLGILVASKVNQWTLLVGTIPVFYMFAAGKFASFPLDSRQQQEIALTAAQSLLAIMFLANLNLSLREAGLLAGLFFAQLLMPWAHGWFIGIYLGVAAFVFCRRWRVSLNSWAAIVGELMPWRR
jgi:cation:H+ antiporter